MPWAGLGEHNEVWTLWNGRHHRSPPTAPASAVAGTRRVRQSANTPHRLRPVRPLANLRRVHGGRAQPPPAPPATPSRPGPAHLSLHMRALLAQDTLNGLYTLGYFQALPSAVTVIRRFSVILPRRARGLRHGAVVHHAVGSPLSRGACRPRSSVAAARARRSSRTGRPPSAPTDTPGFARASSRWPPRPPPRPRSRRPPRAASPC